MKILLITSAFAPVVSARSERAVALARLLRNVGHEVRVASLDLQYSAAAENYEPGDYSDAHLVVESGLYGHLKERASLKVFRVGLDLLTGAPGPFIYESRRMYSALVRSPLLQECDVVWVTTPPHELQLVGCRIAADYGIPYIMDLRDPWGESTRIRWMSRWHRRVAQRLYHRCLSQSIAVIANTPQHFAVVQQAHGPEVAGKLHLIPNGYFEEDFTCAERTGMGVQLPASGDSVPVLVYAGGLYGGQVEAALESLHRAAESRGTPIRIRLLGANGGRYPFDYGGVVPPSRVVEEIINATWLFLLMPVGAATGPVMSLKAYQYARSGKPILYSGPKNETYAYLTERCSVVDLDNPETALTRLFAASHRASTSDRCRVAAEDSWEARMPRIEHVLCTVTRNNPSGNYAQR